MFVQPSQIAPAESYQISYFLRNHTDATSYYVRVRVYDVQTGELLDTQNLEQSATNSRLFIKTLTAPADPAGYGRSIVAIATVYTDSGYTTKSDNYEEQEQYFLVKVPQLFGGGGSIDLDGLRRSLVDYIDQKFAGLPEPSPLPEMPFEALFGAIGALQREVNRVPKETFDTAQLIDAVGGLKAAIAERPHFEKTDLSGLEQGVTAVLTALADARKDFARLSATMLNEQQRAAGEMAEQMLTRVEAGLKDLMGRQELTIPLSSLIKEKPATEPQPVDLSHLM
jgi:hypothetical protein